MGNPFVHPRVRPSSGQTQVSFFTVPLGSEATVSQPREDPGDLWEVKMQTCGKWAAGVGRLGLGVWLSALPRFEAQSRLVWFSSGAWYRRWYYCPEPQLPRLKGNSKYALPPGRALRAQ